MTAKKEKRKDRRQTKESQKGILNMQRRAENKERRKETRAWKQKFRTENVRTFGRR
jgi:hypothetical protein